MRIFLILLAALTCCSPSSASERNYARDGLILGDWRMVADIIIDDQKAGYNISAETDWNYSERGRSNCTDPNRKECFKLGIHIECLDNHFQLSFSTICQTCGPARDVDVAVSIDGRRAFTLRGADDPPSLPLPNPYGDGVRVSLTADQVAQLSKMHSVLIEPSNRSALYAEPSGTALALATLSAACSAPWAPPRD